MQYDQFIEGKTRRAATCGFEPKPLTAPAFDWQGHVIKWAVRQGRAALFEECGLGKSLQQLEWADQVTNETGLPVLVLTPLSVAPQTASEAIKFGLVATVVSTAEEITGQGVFITNYDKLDHFDGVEFGGVVLDESSILKNFTGKTRIKLTDRFSRTPYRLCCTATPSPNDYTEFGQHAEFLGVCSSAQMLATFFINDTFNTGDWRLKKHAESEFWKWVASWAACVSKPSDIGFSDEGYILPKLNLESVVVHVDAVEGAGEGELFRAPTLSATTMHAEMRMTSPARVEAVAKLVTASTEQWLVWCNTNDEADQLKKAMPDAVDVRGSDTPAHKERAAVDFVAGKIRVIISKPGIYGYGLNLQNCHNLAFVGLSYSFEDFYQALRRSYRFGQTREVNAYVVQASTEDAITRTIRRKIAQHEKMQSEMKVASLAFMETVRSCESLPEKSMSAVKWLVSQVNGGENTPCQNSHDLATSAVSQHSATQAQKCHSATMYAKESGRKLSGLSQSDGLDRNTKTKERIALRLPQWWDEIQNPYGIGSNPAELLLGDEELPKSSSSKRVTNLESEESIPKKRKKKSDKPDSKTGESHAM